MSSKKTGDGSPAKKKPAAKKGSAKKPAASASKKKPAPASAADKRKRAKTERMEPVRPVPVEIVEDLDAELDVDVEPASEERELLADADDPRHDGDGHAHADDVDAIEDADILAETPAPLRYEADELAAEAARIDAEATPIAPLSDEERELSAIYGDDLNAPAAVHTEYQDRQTRDEDRPMTPEINARDERKQHWQDRRRQRQERRDRERQERRDRNEQRQGTTNAQGQGPQNHQRPRHDQTAAQQRLPLPAGSSPGIAIPPPAPAGATNGHDHDSLARVGTPLGDAAATVFAQLRNGQPLPLRQLAAMMRKRNLIEVDPEQLAPQLKAELLGDERSYRALGLRPRIVYRGRDLFAPGPVAMSATAEAEASVASSLSRLAGATHRVLAQRIARASAPGFERLIHAYLVAAGYREVSWVKRLGGISYASATAPGIERTVLISARSGDQPIDRRGIGELRVGVEAKNLVAGILFSARELSEDAERELERAGRSIAVICGDQLVAALIAAGVGVVSAAAPLHYVDDQLLDELLAG